VGDMVVAPYFPGMAAPTPTITDLLSGWEASRSMLRFRNVRVKRATLGYESAKTRFGMGLTLTPDHPVLVERKDGMYAFVSAALVEENARLVQKGYTTISAGSVVTEVQNNITFSLELEFASAVVANGVICHVGTVGSLHPNDQEGGFTVLSGQLDPAGGDILQQKIVQPQPSIYHLGPMGQKLNAVQLYDLTQLPMSVRGRLASAVDFSGCNRFCSCTPSLQQNSLGGGGHVFSESQASVPCCSDMATGSEIVSCSITPDNRFLTSFVDVRNGSETGTYVVARPLDALTSQVYSILCLGDNADGDFTTRVCSEMVRYGTSYLFAAVEGSSSQISLVGFDGFGFTSEGAYLGGDGNSIMCWNLCMPRGMSPEIHAVDTDGSSSSYVVFRLDEDSTMTRVVIDRLDTASATAIATLRFVSGGWISVAGGSGHLVAWRGFAEQSSIPLPVRFLGEDLEVSTFTWKVFSARDGESILVVACPDDPADSKLKIFRGDTDGTELVLKRVTGDPISVLPTAKISASGMQGKFCLVVEGDSAHLQIDLTKMTSERVEKKVVFDSATGCSKSDDLIAILSDGLTRCPSCDNSGSCNTGGVLIIPAGSVRTGKTYVNGCLG